MARLILTSPGESAIVGGDFDVIGTSSSGDEIEVISGNIRFDASFNGGGDTISLPGDPDEYVVTFQGSRAILTGDDGLIVSIPLGPNVLNLEFRSGESDPNDDASFPLQIVQGEVQFGDQILEAGDRLDGGQGGAALAMAKDDPLADMLASSIAELPALPDLPDLDAGLSIGRLGGTDFHIA